MIYSSLLFIYGFLPVSLLLYYITPKKHQPLTLLLLSMVFCGMFGLCFLAFILLYTLINYAAGLLIQRTRNKRGLSALPYAAVTIFDILAIFVFRAEMFSTVREFIHLPEAFFPVGISFFTLSAVGTLTDIYKGRISAERDFVRFGLYIMLFPRLIMGPVLRYSGFAKVLDERRTGLGEMGIGFTIFVKGLAKKVIAADSMYMLFTAVRSVDVREMSALTAWLGITAYLLCLYFTLSGFADMGTGIGYCFGLRLPQSFNYPLFSTKLKYFGARWHIQVLHWFRRYVTKPFSGLSRNRIYKKLILVAAWGIFGFWYTFSANGAIWGIVLGVGIVFESRFSHVKTLNITGVIYTYFAVILCSVFLSGESISYSMRYLLAMVGGNGILADALSLYFLKSYIVILLICMYASTSLFRNMMMRSGKTKLRTALEAVSPVIVLFLLICCTALISYGGSSEMLLINL